MERVTIKSKIKNGTRKALSASEKQTKYANDILNTINAALNDVAQLGFPQYADEAGEIFDARTDMVQAGVHDVIEYLREVTKFNVFQECYKYARRDRNSAAVNALNPMKLEVM